MEYFGPGPFNTSLLTLQEKHISTSIWDGEETLFRARYNLWQTLPSEQVLQVIRNTAFANLLNIGRAEINNHLLTAMVERWRPETHTFHFPNGECTITLEDVAYQLGIPIDGKAVTGDTSLDWGDLCQQLLGVTPSDKQIMGQRPGIRRNVVLVTISRVRYMDLDGVDMDTTMALKVTSEALE
ncbi:PREDICTED: serine/threonine-protein phosphatase 7 long form homolog [Lupinus angustifolius]|uniref:serine/threonine-protein phosphatase 7 long form homolog n=1 Tax=Lupinus angustifolius TaxID=3871 RepID=UPI00092ED464|nr:PREDICTED: serine/threonine-protein phosphatase 7 long form homolog [Lupinus angustifolius]